MVTTEPLAKDSPLLGRDNVIITPHTAFYSIEALDELQTKCASDVARVLERREGRLSDQRMSQSVPRMGTVLVRDMPDRRDDIMESPRPSSPR